MAPLRTMRSGTPGTASGHGSRARADRLAVAGPVVAEALGAGTLRGLFFGVPISLALWAALLWLIL